MRFTWPLALLALLVLPLLLGIYVLQLRRRRKTAVRFSNVALVRAALPRRASWRRHIPVALFLAALGSMAVAGARPQVTAKVPLSRTSIMLAFDVSRSMCATDVEPNRLSVAQEAARSFVKSQPSGTRIGIVAFSGFAELVVPPTTDKSELIGAINGFTTSRGTAIGAATLKSIDAIAEINPEVKPSVDTFANIDTFDTFNPGFDPGFDPSATPTTVVTTTPAAPPAGGKYVPDVIVLLTDGANTRGIDPVEAAKQAVERRVRVYTIGFGTVNPTAMVCTREQLGAEAFGDFGGGFGGGGPGGGGFGGPGGGGFGPGGPGGRARFLVIDEPTLRQVATMTGGQFYKAEDAPQLRKVFENLPAQVVLQKRNVEITAAFGAIAAVLAIAAMALSLLWNRGP